MSTVREWVKDNAGRFPTADACVEAGVKELGVTRSVIFRRLRDEQLLDYQSLAQPASPVIDDFIPTPVATAQSLSRRDLAVLYDLDTRTRTAMRAGVALLTNEESYIPDSVFRTQQCQGAPNNNWRRIASEAEFRAFQVRFKESAVYWTTPEGKKWALIHISAAREV